MIADLAPIAFKQDQQLSFHGESSRLWGDELLLGILFKNLLDNAIRYSGHSSQIAVELSDHDGEIEVRVSDTGAAIDDLTREKMFDNFYRANSQKAMAQGLACRSVVILQRFMAVKCSCCHVLMSVIPLLFVFAIANNVLTYHVALSPSCLTLSRCWLRSFTPSHRACLCSGDALICPLPKAKLFGYG